MEAALDNLNDDHRLVLKLRYVDQLTFVQIAERLDRTTGAIRGLHRTALRSLRRMMGGSSLFFPR
jgi:RNA polymerase sigma factor (sigma-70 family)